MNYFSCEKCNYKTIYSFNLKKHFNTKKHKKKCNNEELNNKNISKVSQNYSEYNCQHKHNVCIYCNSEFKHKSSLSKHIKYCNKKVLLMDNYKETIRQLNEKLKLKDVLLEEKDKQLTKSEDYIIKKEKEIKKKEKNIKNMEKEITENKVQISKYESLFDSFIDEIRNRYL